jgi:anti-sigma regulatory factor (Ser/Thr protein kinase)
LLRSSTVSDPTALAALRQKVRQSMIRAGLPLQTVGEMEVAVGEILSNVHRHAYLGDVGPVSVALFCYPHRISVLIIDRGHATTAPAVPATLPSDRGGLYLVSRLVDDVRIRVNRAGYGLRVRLTKHLEPAETGADGLQAA